MEESSTEPSYPLRLRWKLDVDDRGHKTWLACDGPWEIGYVADLSHAVSSKLAAFTWEVTRLSKQDVGVGIGGRTYSARDAAESVERAFFGALPHCGYFTGGVEEAIEYAAWLGVPLPRGNERERQIFILGENPMPLTPHLGQLSLWGQRERERGRRGLITPEMMVEHYGPNWRDRCWGLPTYRG